MRYFERADAIAKHPQTEVLIVSEGPTEVGFACRYLAAVGADENVTKVICYQGNNKLSLFTKTLVKDCEVLAGLRSVGVIADSERSPSGRLAAFIALGEALGFRGCARSINEDGKYTVGTRKFAVSLSPRNDSPGRIEELILEELRAGVAYSCFSSAFTCSALFGSGGMSEKGMVTVLSAALLDEGANGRAGAKHAFEAGKFDVLASPYANHRDSIDFLLA